MAPDTVIHELGHTMGLQHAASPAYEYGDGSTTMGSGAGVRCHNAPHTWQLGWSSPIASLNKANLPAGEGGRDGGNGLADDCPFQTPSLTFTLPLPFSILPTLHQARSSTLHSPHSLPRTSTL
jgi:hypothetical protein